MAPYYLALNTAVPVIVRARGSNYSRGPMYSGTQTL